MTNMNDKQLQQFFAEHKMDVADKGFSDKVIHRLPEKQRVPGLVWIFGIISTLVVIFSGNYYRVFRVFMAILDTLGWWILPVVSCTIAAAIVFAVASYERRQAIFR
ncbi:hypothetical protein PJIAN_172 [Paludibacter jiangxiensis]|uniref:DUF5056 domain-containing protein n=2 Tax=Paludibacter jiangxiensis TaxID=681398 RepID=A0A170Y3W6_9BACT|nr:hypothetical protein PJIAN_172 [Paludibacter jiangxiensis]